MLCSRVCITGGIDSIVIQCLLACVYSIYKSPFVCAFHLLHPAANTEVALIQRPPIERFVLRSCL